MKQLDGMTERDVQITDLEADFRSLETETGRFQTTLKDIPNDSPALANKLREANRP
jgi:hypothetical protein